ncbi:unnamed protein product [Brachionus calyciflorus]|uniref:Uncharacterized protein n=1 Tax=Brachionus calyciflorus TaxID=104777 RepID=A0A814CWW3_9BILA|nr:unnamed protein product [Brachionus calyciflorus]
MLKLIIFLLALNLVSSYNNSSELIKEDIRCAILNDKSSDYLFEGSTIFFSKTLHRIRTYYIVRSTEYVLSLFRKDNFRIFNDDNSALWILEPIDSRKNVFYIKNSNSGNYLFASDEFQYFLFIKLNNRYVYSKKSDQLDESFMWKLSKHSNDGKFYIRNVKYNELLFQQVRHTKVSKFNDVSTKTNQKDFKYYWTISCNKNFSQF